MNFQRFLENLNEGALCVCVCTSLWLVLASARADNLLVIPYWAVFFPLWLWKFFVFTGWLVGLIVWFKRGKTSIDPEHTPFLREDPALPLIQAMSVSALFHLIIVCSEILLCIHLSIPSSTLTYLSILSPLLVVGALGVFGFLFVMIDSRSVFSTTPRRRRRQHRSRSSSGQDPYFVTPRPRHMCSFTLELGIAANLLQILFLIARLDNWIRSNWIVTFIPSFILLAMGFLFCLAGLTVALITYFTALSVPVAQRRLPVCYYASHLFIVVFLCTSLVLLGLRLDGYLSPSKVSYLLICVPVLISLLLYIAFSSGPGNPWWFGLNRNVLLAIFEACPALQLYANTRITATGFCKPPRDNQTDNDSDSSSRASTLYQMGPSLLNSSSPDEIFHIPDPSSSSERMFLAPPTNSPTVSKPKLPSTDDSFRPLVALSFTDSTKHDHLLRPD